MQRKVDRTKVPLVLYLAVLWSRVEDRAVSMHARPDTGGVEPAKSILGAVDQLLDCVLLSLVRSVGHYFNFCA